MNVINLIVCIFSITLHESLLVSAPAQKSPQPSKNDVSKIAPKSPKIARNNTSSTSRPQITKHLEPEIQPTEKQIKKDNAAINKALSSSQGKKPLTLESVKEQYLQEGLNTKDATTLQTIRRRITNINKRLEDSKKQNENNLITTESEVDSTSSNAERKAQLTFIKSLRDDIKSQPLYTTQEITDIAHSSDDLMDINKKLTDLIVNTTDPKTAIAIRGRAGNLSRKIIEDQFNNKNISANDRLPAKYSIASDDLEALATEKAEVLSVINDSRSTLDQKLNSLQNRFNSQLNSKTSIASNSNEYRNNLSKIYNDGIQRIRQSQAQQKQLIDVNENEISYESLGEQTKSELEAGNNINKTSSNQRTAPKSKRDTLQAEIDVLKKESTANWNAYTRSLLNSEGKTQPYLDNYISITFRILSKRAALSLQSIKSSISSMFSKAGVKKSQQEIDAMSEAATKSAPAPDAPQAQQTRWIASVSKMISDAMYGKPKQNTPTLLKENDIVFVGDKALEPKIKTILKTNRGNKTKTEEELKKFISASDDKLALESISDIENISDELYSLADNKINELQQFPKQIITS